MTDSGWPRVHRVVKQIKGLTLPELRSLATELRKLMEAPGEPVEGALVGARPKNPPGHLSGGAAVKPEEENE